MNKVAIVTGVLGQTASYLVEFLLENGYVVHGIHRRVSTGPNLSNLKKCINHKNLNLIAGDITDNTLVPSLLTKLKPGYFFNLAAQSHVGDSFANPAHTFEVNAHAVISQLEAIRTISPDTKYIQMSTSEMFGNSPMPEKGYNENSILNPQSPYAISKVAAHHSVELYRKAYGLKAYSLICFNHESPRRGLDFVTRKITNAFANAKNGISNTLVLGNINSFRDFGYARDYAQIILKVAENLEPDTFVISTGETHEIKEIIDLCFEFSELTERDIKITHSPDLLRPAEVNKLKGDNTKLFNKLHWMIQTPFRRLIEVMYRSDL